MSEKTPLQRPFYVRIPEDLNLPFIPRQEPSPVPPKRIYEEPLTCPVRVNKMWLKHILGALEVLNVADTWIGTKEQVFNTLQDVELLMRLLATSYCGDDFMIEFRQNPDNPCQLEQSLDGGATWRLAFDYEKCYEKMGSKPSPQETVKELEDGKAMIDDIETAITNEGLENVYPEAVAEPEDPLAQHKRDALCWAINEWNRLYAKQIEASTEYQTTPIPDEYSQIERIGAAGEVLTSGWGLAGLLLFGGAAGPIAIGGAAFTFGMAVADNWNLFWTSVGQLKDQIFGTQEPTPPIDVPNAWIDRVSCEMYQNMKDQTLTQAVFTGSLAGVQGNNVQESIYLVLWGIQVGFGQNWYAFLDLYEKFYRILAAKDNPYDCDGCLDYCYPLYHQYLYIQELPPYTQFFTNSSQSSPEYGGDSPTPFDYIPNANQGTFFAVNQWGRFILEYTPEQACALGVKATWMRGNTNSAWMRIFTYHWMDGWIERRSDSIAVGGVANQPRTVTWQNTDLYSWEKIRVVVNTTAPRINIFELFDLGT